MNKTLLRALFCVLMLSGASNGLANSDRFLGPRDRRGLKAAIEGYIKHNDSIFQYGNWYGPGWWGGEKGGDKPGNKLPVDSLDAIAQKHDFGYQIAEQQGKIYGIAEEKRLKAIADYIAVRDAKALPENPKGWLLPATDPIKAARYRDRMITGFSYEAPTYESVAVVGKGLDWATSPIENWELDRTHQLNAADLEKRINILQKDWNTKHFPPLAHPEKPVIAPAKTNSQTPELGTTNKLSDKNDATKPENNAIQKEPEKTTKPNVKSADSNKNDIKSQNKNTQTSLEQANAKELENDPDYVELIRLTNEMMALANGAMAQAKAGKIPSTGTVNKITALQSRISALSKHIEAKYAKKLNQQQNENHTPKTPANNGDRGGTVYNKDGSKDVLHYEKDPDGKEVAVWITYDKNGREINRRHDK